LSFGFVMVKFREFKLSSGRKIFLGRDSASNDELVFAASPKDTLVHTELPGSPFVNLGEAPGKDEVYAGCVFVRGFLRLGGI
jgi:predicted ribosome quality control (RQC) complex YloA/Tae2 family protein